MHGKVGEEQRAGVTDDGDGDGDRSDNNGGDGGGDRADRTGGLSFPWDDLRVFLAVQRAGSISAAARLLRANQSTVSRRLTALEEAIGKPLFDRLPEGTRPTALAEELLASAERAEEATLDVARVVAGFEVEPAGVVRLASVPDLLRTVIAPNLPSLLQKHPRLRLELVGSSALVDLTRREADLAIRFVRPTHGDLVVRAFASAPFRVMASASYLARRPPPTTWDDLDWITWDAGLDHLPEAAWMRDNVHVPPVLRTNDFGTQRAAAEAGVGVVALPGLATSALVEVHPTQPGTPLPTIRSYLVGHRALRDVPRLRVVWQWLLGLAGEVDEGMSRAG